MVYLLLKISKKKDDYILYFDNELELRMNEDVFTDYFFYVGKQFSQDEITEISKRIERSKWYYYAYNLILSKPYSSKNIYLKLINIKRLSSHEAMSIIDELKEKNILNDKRYAVELVDELHNKKYGYERIVQKLGEDGIDGAIYQVAYDEEFELEKAKSHLPSLQRKFELLSLKKQKESLFNAYFRLGFKKDVINLVLSSINQYDLLGEYVNLKRDFLKITYRLSKEDIKTQKQKIIDKLLRKGYQYKDIAIVMEEE